MITLYYMGTGGFTNHSGQVAAIEVTFRLKQLNVIQASCV